MIDILDKTTVTGEEIKQLNFICDLPTYHFRKHFRQGLRSHIFEVLSADDVQKESKGEIVDGIKMFPRAIPKYMLRILRARFSNLDEALSEVDKYFLLLKFLGPDLIARSDEFIVEYRGADTNSIILCGLQEYVSGFILDPWSLTRQVPFETFFRANFPSKNITNDCVTNAVNSIYIFVKNIRDMIFNSGYIPDLAGNGNIVLTSTGKIKLVDINNIIKIEKNDTILLDDKHYPSCDKSVEVLAIFEQEILKTKNLLNDSLYRFFLREERKEKVHQLEKKFYQTLKV